MNFEEMQSLQNEYLERLERLTLNNQAYWFRKDSDSDLVFCLINNDIHIFELDDGSEDRINAFENPHGITVKVRNCSFMWLEGAEGWDLLLSMIQCSKVDNKRLAIAKAEVLKTIVSEL